jgi:protocatechuate 3,4-dioxygenase alpha subunit
VLDGDGQPVGDCMLEIWQADAQGRFSDPQDKRALPNSAFKGFGRCGTDPNGDYAFDTIRPGQVPDPDGKPQAPHLSLAIFARGMLLHNLHADLFRRRGGQRRRSDAGAGAGRSPRHPDRDAQAGQWQQCVYRFDIRLQGDDETVFFDI